MCTLILGLVGLLLIPVLLLVRLFKRSAPPRIVSTAVATQPGIGWTEEFLFGSQDAENEFITHAMTDINSVQVKNKRKGKADRIRRAFHAKVHAGIKNAKFHVNADIAPNLQSAFLTPGAIYDAWLRFSNASGLLQPDSAKDLRGLVAGIFDNDGIRHDFLGTSAAASPLLSAVTPAACGAMAAARKPDSQTRCSAVNGALSGIMNCGRGVGWMLTAEPHRQDA